MELTLKKRIVGILILIALALLITPFFFGQSVPVSELQLSARVPNPPPMPVNFAIAIPPQSATTPPLAKVTQTAGKNLNARIAQEQIQTIADSSSEPMSSSSATDAMVSSGQGAAKITATPNAPANKNDLNKVPTPSVSEPVTEPPTALSPVTLKNTIPAASPALDTIQTTPPNSPSAQDTVENTASAPMLASAVTEPAPPAAKPVSAKASTLANPPSVSAVHSQGKRHPAHTANIPGAFAVQLGSFSDKINAENLMKKLQAQGFTAYIHTTKMASGTWIRVLVGPELRRADAQALQSKLQKVTNLQSVIVKAGN